MFRSAILSMSLHFKNGWDMKIVLDQKVRFLLPITLQLSSFLPVEKKSFFLTVQYFSVSKYVKNITYAKNKTLNCTPK